MSDAWRSVFEAAEACLAAVEVDEKLRLTQVAAQAWRDGLLKTASDAPPLPIGQPGRPPKPALVKPGNVPKRGLGSEAGRLHLIHALAHIEFNAIDLAWDAVYRFRDMPAAFYGDWIRVADEEAYHFGLLRDRLRDRGHEYGDFPAHNGLWEMARKTAFDPMVRMALVPRVLEARGLDVTPTIMKRLRSVGDEQTVACLEVILTDEVGHVAIGSRWFAYECERRGLDMETTFRNLIQEYYEGELRGPFHVEARMKAGFSAAELRALESLAGSGG